MRMPIETKKDIYGRDFNYMHLGLVKGRNLLSENGYKQSENPLYYSNEAEYWHYNGKCKAWLHEVKA